MGKESRNGELSNGVLATQPANPDEPVNPDKPADRRLTSRPQVRLGAILALAAVVAFVVWLLVRDRGGNEQKTNAVGVSQQGLDALAASVSRPFYWVGPRPNVTYELTQSPDGRTYLRYLPKGVAVGTSKPYLTVGTYRVANAFKVTQAVARKKGSVTIPTRPGSIAFYSASRPTNVYVAYSGSNDQIEVYDPSATLAHQAVTRGQLQPLSVRRPAKSAPAAKVAAVAATPTSLKSVAKKLGHPIYWAGTSAGKTYELTQTPDGRVYIRYLPQGVKVGVVRPYLTVATYPVANALAVTRAAAKNAGTVAIKIGNGVAFYAKSRPTNVYVAYPRVNEQIEVFAPSAQQARHVVAAHLVRPVP
jgi:hypothetical protein